LSGIRHEGGVNLNWAEVRNVGTGGLMARENLKRWTRKRQSTDAGPRGGMTCSSDEARQKTGWSEEVISSCLMRWSTRKGRSH
jgi:hypothetical protein